MDETPETFISQRYAVLRLLGEGGMGTVHLARDAAQGDREVALKLLRPEGLSRDAVELFKNEFRAMTRLRHPNLAEVYDFGTIEAGGRHFLSMEYVQGESLASLDRAAVAADFDGLAVQCLRALDYIHSRGILHNDIKPQNIMIRPPSQVKLLDFGLARGSAQAGNAGISGTLHYVAPERFEGRAVDGRSDLYSLGVVLYQVLTGSLPFAGQDAGQVVGAILRGRATAPRSLDAAISPRHEAFVMALLARDPAARPAGAAAALDLLNAGRAEPLRLDTQETYASYVTSGRFIGRDRELQELLDLAITHVRRAGEAGTDAGAVAGPTAAAIDGEALPRLVLVSGPSGIGKSRLLREMKHRLQLSGVPNFTGRCYQDGGVPFQSFVEILRQLPRPADLPPALRATVDAMAPDAGAPAPPADQEKIGRQEFLHSMAESLARLAAGARGVVFLEDLQWSDSPGTDLVEHLVQRADAGPWLYIGSLRDDTDGTRPALEALNRLAGSSRVRRVALAPLDREQVTDLIASMVPFEARPEGLARVLADHSAGNPLYLEEFMKSLAEAGTLRRAGGAWTAESRALDAIRLPASLGSAVVQRLAGLADDARLLADLLAIFNRPTSCDLLAAATALDEARLERAIEGLDRLRVATQDTRTGGLRVVDLAHSRIREAIYGALTEDRRIALHRAAALAIEAANKETPDAAAEDLAHHFLAAGEKARAADYLLRAAAKANALCYPKREMRFYEQALECLPADDFARRMPALQMCSQILSNDLADFDGGLRYSRLLYDVARQAASPLYEVIALREIAWNLDFIGDHAGAMEHARRSLALSRPLTDKYQEMWDLNVMGMLCARHSDHAEASEHFQAARRMSEATGDVKAQITIAGNEGMNDLGRGEIQHAFHLLETSVEAARRHGLDYARHRLLAALGSARFDVGDLPGAIRDTEQLLSWSREHLNDLFAIQAHENLGFFLMHTGRFDRALTFLDQGQTLRKQEGDRTVVMPILDFTGAIHRELGHRREAARLHREGIDIARAQGDRVQEGFMLVSLARDLLKAGDVAAAEETAQSALPIARDMKRPRVLAAAHCVVALAAAARRDRRAMALATRTLTHLDTKTLRIHDRLLLNLTLARCALASDRPQDAEREARTGLAVAEKGGLREYQWRFTALLAEAASMRGLPDDAKTLYNSARTIIERIAAEIENPTMKKDYENEETRQQVVARSGDVTEIPVVSEVAARAAKGDPVRMLTTIYQVSQIINSILDLKELLNKVMDQAIDLVGAERGLIFLYRSETDEMEMVVARNMEHQTIQDATEYSRSVLQEAGHGRAILSHDAETDERFKEFRSVSIYHIRSLLCVPLRLKNRIIGTVYVDTRLQGVVFTEDDLKFLEAFANQAAIAVENARLFEKAKQENVYLKQAVQERYGFENIIGRSPRMREVFSLLTRISPSGLPVMIRGESGTGKELVARAIHHNSPRRDRRFFTENCAALPDTLLESELFGHARGAFTGADSVRRGMFELADGGTVFLDEVGDMSMPMQSKLLRVLQDGEFRPVGSETARKTDVRILSATSRDLESMIKQKTFREDLYFRLKGITVKIPPVRDRREDIPLLIDHCLAKIARDNKTTKLHVDRDLMALLIRHDWPGNVRELENEVYRLALFASGDTLTLQDAQADPEFSARLPHSPTRAADTGLTRDDMQRALNQANGNRDEAAKILGISRATFFRKMKQHQLGQKRPRLVRPPHTA